MGAIKIDHNEIELLRLQMQKVSEQVAQLQKEKKKPIINLLTDKEVCELLGVSRRTLLNYRNDKKIGFAIIGKKVYYKPEDIEAFVASFHVKAEN